jgi:hypothetical protein
VGALLVDARQIDRHNQDLRLIDGSLCQDCSSRIGNETLPPKLDAAVGIAFMTGAIDADDVAPVGDPMRTLDDLPTRVLRRAICFSFSLGCQPMAVG